MRRNGSITRLILVGTVLLAAAGGETASTPGAGAPAPEPEEPEAPEASPPEPETPPPLATVDEPPPPPPPVEEPPPTPLEGPATESVTVPSGTSFQVRLLSQVTTRWSRPGDLFLTELTSPITDGRRVLLPAGTTIRGVVTRVRQPSGRGGAGRVVSGALAGAILGRIFGGNTKGALIGAGVGAGVGALGSAGGRPPGSRAGAGLPDRLRSGPARDNPAAAFRGGQRQLAQAAAGPPSRRRQWTSGFCQKVPRLLQFLARTP